MWTLWTPRPLVYTYSSGQDGHRKRLGTGEGTRRKDGTESQSTLVEIDYFEKLTLHERIAFGGQSYEMC